MLRLRGALLLFVGIVGLLYMALYIAFDFPIIFVREMNVPVEQADDMAAIQAMLPGSSIVGYTYFEDFPVNEWHIYVFEVAMPRIFPDTWCCAFVWIDPAEGVVGKIVYAIGDSRAVYAEYQAIRTGTS